MSKPGQHKEGYEEASPLLQSTSVPEPAQPTRSWNGHLLNCFGDCDALGWGTCIVTHYLPCVTFGLTQKRFRAVSALRAGLLFGTMILLSYMHCASRFALVANDCLAEEDMFLDGALASHESSLPRRLGPQHDAAPWGDAAAGVSFADVRARAAKPFGTPVHPDKVDSELCGRLVTTSLALNLVTLLYSVGLIVYGARLRTQMRERFGIDGAHWKDVLAWWMCMPCALCQESRTMHANNVVDGTWHGATPALPVYYAADETTAPSVPVMKQ